VDTRHIVQGDGGNKSRVAMRQESLEYEGGYVEGAIRRGKNFESAGQRVGARLEGEPAGRGGAGRPPGGTTG